MVVLRIQELEDGARVDTLEDTDVHWQNVTQTEAGMAMTVKSQGVTEEGECLLLESVPTVTYSVGNALMWWNSHAKTVGHVVAYAMT
ncbi:hypothetical protein Tco_0989689 [Tanacetum coccineum]|uniref:Uncharacterized protein n=1 Tax=Tanacetum coccineum TaxID=301880 RepID=A0ABQ5EUM5_9ASTR